MRGRQRLRFHEGGDTLYQLCLLLQGDNLHFFACSVAALCMMFAESTEALLAAGFESPLPSGRSERDDDDLILGDATRVCPRARSSPQRALACASAPRVHDRRRGTSGLRCPGSGRCPT